MSVTFRDKTLVVFVRVLLSFKSFGTNKKIINIVIVLQY